jgi:hypothetical protein
MNDKVFQALAKTWLTRVGLNLVVTVGLGSVFCCFGTALLLIPERWLDPDLRALLLVGGMCLGLVAVLVFVIATVLISNRRVYAQFDEAFTPLGLTRSRYLLRGFRYQGAYRGRQVTVLYYVTGGRYLRSPSLQIYLSGSFRTRLGIGTESALTRLGGNLTGQTPLSLSEPAYEGLIAYPLDEAWSRQLLGEAEARDIIVRLVGKDTPGVRGLVFGPETVRLQVMHFGLNLITPEAVRQWFDDLLRLCEIGEGAPPPTQTAQASDWERADRSDRGRFLWPVIAITLAVVAVCPFAVGGCVIGIMVLQGAFP